MHENILVTNLSNDIGMLNLNRKACFNRVQVRTLLHFFTFMSLLIFISFVFIFFYTVFYSKTLVVQIVLVIVSFIGFFLMRRGMWNNIDSLSTRSGMKFGTILLILCNLSFFLYECSTISGTVYQIIIMVALHFLLTYQLILCRNWEFEYVKVLEVRKLLNMSKGMQN